MCSKHTMCAFDKAASVCDCRKQCPAASARGGCSKAYQLAYAQRDSLSSMAATVIADGELAGDAKQASLALLPASGK